VVSLIDEEAQNWISPFMGENCSSKRPLNMSSSCWIRLS